MRTIVTILLMMFLAQTTKAQEFIFETTAGEIVTKSKFIDQFQNDVYTNITPYILKQTTNESLQNGDSYTINCLKYRNWGNDPGDIHVIQVLHQGKEVFKHISTAACCHTRITCSIKITLPLRSNNHRVSTFQDDICS